MRIPQIEIYDDIRVVREDALFPFPSPNFSKIRGIREHIETIPEKNICILDTIMSRCGWGLSYICRDTDKQVYNFYSQRKQGIDFYRKMSESFGAKTIPLMGTHQRIAKGFAEKWLKDHNISDYHFIPPGLSVKEKIDEHAALIQKLPENLFEGSLVCCVSSGTIFAGIIRGLASICAKTHVYGVQAHTWTNRESVICEKAKITRTKGLTPETNVNWKVIDMGYEYLQTVKESPPFPCDLYLDRKAWSFITKYKDKLESPITFWNIGGEWSPDFGIDDTLRGDGTVKKEEIERWLDGVSQS